MSTLWSIAGASARRQWLDDEQLARLGDRRGQSAPHATLRVAVAELAEAHSYALYVGGGEHDFTASFEDIDGHLLVTAYLNQDGERFYCQGSQLMVEQLAAKLAAMCGPQLISVDGTNELVMPEEHA